MKSLKIVLKKFLPYRTRCVLKAWRRRIVNSFFKRGRSMSINDMRTLLVDELGIVPGDRIIVASSFGNLHAGFSPAELVELLKELVTQDGLIMMPYYPPGNSHEWARQGKVFDMDNMMSSMGILTNVFARSSGVVKSFHPTKAVCAWGGKAREVVKGHEDSITPFHDGSPYAWMIRNVSKSVGLGLFNIPIFHSCEDLPEGINEHYYLTERFNLDVINEGRRLTVSTLVHDPDQQFREPAGQFVTHMGLQTYKRAKCGYTLAYSVDNKELFEKSARYFRAGNTRLAS